MSMILEGVRVLDLSHVYFGPYTTMILADLGAEVIKVEPPWGEIGRKYPPLFGGISYVFLYFNRNKKGATIDLKSEKGREIFFKLLEKSDVVVENFKPGTMERLGLSYEAMREVNPGIIYASLSGFGLTGPYSKRPSFASIASAMSGWMRLTADGMDPEAPPIRPAEWHGDLDPALFAVIGILGALRHRDRTGEGQLVDVAQLDCMVAQCGVSVTGYLMSGMLPWEMREKYMGLRFIGAFKALDGYVYIHTSPAMDERLKRGMGVEELERKEELGSWVEQRTVQEVVDALVEADVPVAPCYNINQVVEDPQVQARGMIVSMEHPTAGTVREPRFPIKFSKTPARIVRPAPLLGQHNEEILTELGYTAEEISEMRREGVTT